MKRLNRVISIFLMLVVCLGLLPVNAFAAEEEKGEIHIVVHANHDGAYFEELDTETGENRKVEEIGYTLTEGTALGEIADFIPCTEADGDIVFAGWSLTTDGDVLDESYLPEDGDHFYAQWDTTSNVTEEDQDLASEELYKENNPNTDSEEMMPEELPEENDAEIKDEDIEKAEEPLENAEEPAEVKEDSNEVTPSTESSLIEEVASEVTAFYSEQPAADAVLSTAAADTWTVTLDPNRPNELPVKYSVKKGNSVGNYESAMRGTTSYNGIFYPEPPAVLKKKATGWATDKEGKNLLFTYKGSDYKYIKSWLSSDIENYVPSNNITLYAVYSDIAAITLDYNGGTMDRLKKDYDYVISGEKLSKSEYYLSKYKPERDGYFLVNWATDAAGKNVILNEEDRTRSYDTQTMMIDISLRSKYRAKDQDTLYAVWAEKLDITLDANGGVFEDDGYVHRGTFSADMKSYQVSTPKDLKMYDYVNPFRKGYYLIGWATDPAGRDMVSTDEDRDTYDVMQGYTTSGGIGAYKPKSSGTLYAIWTPIYTVKLDGNGGSLQNIDKTRYICAGETIGNGIMYLEAYNGSKSLKGFATDAAGKNMVITGNSYYAMLEAAAKYKVTKNITLYAIWADHCYVLLEGNGGSIKNVYMQPDWWAFYVVRGNMIGKLANEVFYGPVNFTNGNKVLKWWATDPDGTNIVTSNITTYKPTSDITLYAIWKDKNAIDVTGIKMNKASASVQKGSTLQLSAAISPANASNKKILWKSNDTGVAKVDANGKVTGIAAGTATITAQAQDGGATSTCKVTVTPIPGGKDPDQMGGDGTALGKGASAAAAEKSITEMKNDSDPEGSTFSELQLKSTKQTKNSIKLTWKKQSGAKKYVVYGNACGKKNKMIKLATVKKNSYTVKKIKAKLKKGTYHKFIVVALDAKNNVITSSKVIHVTTKGGKTNNPTGIKTAASKNKVSVKKGKNFKLKAKTTGSKVKKHVAIRYESTNTKVATVSKSGVIKAKGKGKSTVYVYASNGSMKAIKVAVK